ncbi:MAG TPA: tetratricopeptide repeat protein [Sumerlaeia bacterium]|nr:tetratricopeptide repeat protein [Sumerlaeia bacterium]
MNDAKKENGARKRFLLILLAAAVIAATFLLYRNYRLRGVAALNNQAVGLIDEGRFQEAVPILEQARARDPKNGAVLRNLGKVYGALGQEEKAREAFQAAGPPQ